MTLSDFYAGSNSIGDDTTLWCLYVMYNDFVSLIAFLTSTPDGNFLFFFLFIFSTPG